MNNGEGKVAGVWEGVGLDFIEDSRTFALADFDLDGRVEMILKNRNSPQLRLLRNVTAELGLAIAFRLRGKTSNRDAIGAAVTVETESGRQTRLLQAGSGFLAQHSKELFFGLGDARGLVEATIRWPSGLEQHLRDLPLNHRVWLDTGSAPTRVEAFKTSRGPNSPASALASETAALPDSVETCLLVPVAAPDFS